MRYFVAAAAGFLSAVCFLQSGPGTVATTNAQPPAGAPEVNPKVLAFLKPVDVKPEDSDLQKKLKERHNVGVKLAEERVAEYKKGVRDVTFVFEAARLVADAKLDLAQNAQEKTVVLEQVLDVAKLIEHHLQQQIEKGFGSKADLERAKFGRLSVEIELLKAKQK
ncbi:MAG: hypothetical protein L0215_01990 [Gemmataceae bacterium]|nr:hypothetical protein [Gemmataceae bacterium]